jgi:hypothetical protein
MKCVTFVNISIAPFCLDGKRSATYSSDHYLWHTYYAVIRKQFQCLLNNWNKKIDQSPIALTFLV